MANRYRIEIKELNGQSFELWNLNMEDLLVDREQWATMDLGKMPATAAKEEWDKM